MILLMGSSILAFSLYPAGSSDLASDDEGLEYSCLFTMFPQSRRTKLASNDDAAYQSSDLTLQLRPSDSNDFASDIDFVYGLEHLRPPHSVPASSSFLTSNIDEGQRDREILALSLRPHELGFPYLWARAILT
ncbi:hypothetical protein CDL15_Pgr006873 [Punica granatum]|uniref:Uncharacterized protein n=1 Tax=Punica granatum TaxID=22663 RepID=A0A218X8Y4_PUNGR|nr:hypothetical protein CDL15_Pgr006873 [Punica granatum]PKI34274.1 hypothetical protein CRG98_045325 [Punica granatum]